MIGAPTSHDRVSTSARDSSSWSLLIRVLVITAGRATLERSLTLYLAIAVLALIVVPGNGMKASTITQAAEANSVFRIGLWIAWLLWTAPAARATLATPSTFFLRALPVPRWRLLALHTALLGFVELPWIGLWVFGDGPVAGAAVGMGMVAAHCIVVVPPRHIIGWVIAVSLGATVVLNPPMGVFSAVVLIALPWAVRSAWLRAPDMAEPHEGFRVFGSAPVALSLTYAAIIARQHRALLGRTLFFTGAAVILTYVCVLNNDVKEPRAIVTLGSSFFAPVVTIAASSLSAPILRAERDAHWLLNACGTPIFIRKVSALGTIVVWMSVLGALYSITSGLLLGLHLPALCLFLMVTLVGGASLCAATMAIVRSTLPHRGRAAIRSILACGATLGVTIAAINTIGVWTLVLTVAATLASFGSLRWNNSDYPVQIGALAENR